VIVNASPKQYRSIDRKSSSGLFSAGGNWRPAASSQRSFPIVDITNKRRYGKVTRTPSMVLIKAPKYLAYKAKPDLATCVSEEEEMKASKLLLKGYTSWLSSIDRHWILF
jgi:hypothetical protein